MPRVKKVAAAGRLTKARRAVERARDQEAAARDRIGQSIYRWLEQRKLTGQLRMVPSPPGTESPVQFQIYAEGTTLNAVLGNDDCGAKARRFIISWENMLKRYGLTWYIKDAGTIMLIESTRVARARPGAPDDAEPPPADDDERNDYE